jgi:glucose/arabinose dehydrogenase
VTARLIRAAIFLSLAGCGPSAGTNAQQSQASAASFAITDVATFDSPWAMAFLGPHDALVTEKPGRLWLVDLSNGSKQPVSGVPTVVAQGQGGLLYVARSPDGLIYLTYAAPSPAGGSSLALARARLVGARLEGLQVIWRDPEGGRGGQLGAIVAFAPDGRSLFLSTGDRQRFTPPRTRASRSARSCT